MEQDLKWKNVFWLNYSYEKHFQHLESKKLYREDFCACFQKDYNFFQK